MIEFKTMKNPELNNFFAIPEFAAFNDAVEILGFVEGTSRNWSSQGKFPLPIHPINGSNFVKTSDLRKFIEDPSTKFDLVKDSYLIPTTPVKIRGRGRPKKMQAELGASS